jgi:hypothetical protein
MVTDAQLKRAAARGRKALADEPRALAARFDRRMGRVVVELTNGCSYAFPSSLVQDLSEATATELSEVHVEGAGFNLHWPQLEADLYVPTLVAGFFGNQAWMTRELARTAGRAKSSAKTAAARRNGQKGGRPRKIARG